MFDSPHMANQKYIQCFLSNEQIRELVTFVTEQFGNDLSGDELSEAIQLAMEGIPGIEAEPAQSIHCVINQVRNLYHDIIKQND